MSKLLLEMNSDERIDAAQDILEAHKVPEEKKDAISFMLGSWENVTKDVKLDEANTTADVSVLAKMAPQMITRGFGQAAATEICGLWPLKSDQGKIAYMRNYYTEDQANSVKPTSSQILVLGDASSFSVDGDIAGEGSGTGTVRYIEDNTIFVEVATGTFSISQNVDNAAAYAAAETTVSAVYSAEIAQNVFGEYSKFASILAGETASTSIKEVEIGVDLHNVEAENHKLRMRYTNEFVARLKSYYGVDADSLTDNVASLALRLELNRRVFNEISDNAVLGGVTGWDYDSDSDGRWEEEKIKTLLTLLNFKSAEILQSNFMEAGTYIVIDPITYAFFVSYGYLDTSMLPGGMAQPMKNAFVGVLNGMFRVYVNPWLRTRTINMGMKDFGNGMMSNAIAGLFFHPYIPLNITKTIQDSNGQPVKFLWSMYGFTRHPFYNTVGTNDFFRKINVTSLPNIG